MDRFAAMTSFRRVVEARGFAAAARQLGLSPAAITKHVQWLEDELGTPLLHRTTRSVRPTDIGAAYFERCVQVLDDIEEAESAARADHAEPRGRIRMNAPVSFGITFLGPLLARFHEHHPRVSIDLVLDDRQINPSAEGADIVIRISRSLPDSGLVARRLASMSRLVCAAPSYLERRGAPRRPSDLTEHDCVTYSMAAEPDTWHFAARDGSSVEVKVTPCLVANNSLLLRDALAAGIGIGLLPSYVAAADLAAGRLRTVLADHDPLTYDIYALHAVPRQRSARVRALVDLLAAELPRRMELASTPPAPQRPRRTPRRS